MLIEWLGNIFLTVLDFLGQYINLPSFEAIDSISEYLNMVIEYGSNILFLFIPYNSVKFLFILLAAFLLAELAYYIILFILKKIPMAGVS